jgi:hypothetical protein
VPGINRGSAPVTAIYRGSTPVTAVYKGSTLVWSASSMFDQFNRANSTGLGSNWTDLSSTSPYLASVVNDQCKMNIPGGDITGSLLSSRARYNAAVHPNDTGWIEIGVGTAGDVDQTTQAFRRGNNAGTTLTNGVGIQLENSQLSIVSRVSSVDTVQAPCGSFNAGDICRLTQVGTGTSAVHTMTQNGAVVGTWQDTAGVVPTGSTDRSMAVRVDGTSEISFFVFTVIAFSPALDYVSCA